MYWVSRCRARASTTKFSELTDVVDNWRRFFSSVWLSVSTGLIFGTVWRKSFHSKASSPKQTTHVSLQCKLLVYIDFLWTGLSAPLKDENTKLYGKLWKNKQVQPRRLTRFQADFKSTEWDLICVKISPKTNIFISKKGTLKWKKKWLWNL